MAYSRRAPARRRAAPVRRSNVRTRASATRRTARKASGTRSRSAPQTVRLVIEHVGANPVARPIAASEPDGPKRGKF
jgi:hypothetical protein